jgi:hypothetical protein
MVYHMGLVQFMIHHFPQIVGEAEAGWEVNSMPIIIILYLMVHSLIQIAHLTMFRSPDGHHQCKNLILVTLRPLLLEVILIIFFFNIRFMVFWSCLLVYPSWQGQVLFRGLFFFDGAVQKWGFCLVPFSYIFVCVQAVYHLYFFFFII